MRRRPDFAALARQHARDFDPEIAMKSQLFAALFLNAALAPAAALAADHTVSMAGHGEVKAIPDIATINAGVTTSAPTAAQALAANTLRMTGVFAVLTKLGVAQKNIQTINFSVSPQYSNGDNNGPGHVTGYQVSNDVSVRLEDVSRLGAALDALVGAGANQMNGISFDIARPAPLLEQARSDAVADALTRAQTYARAAGVALGPVLSISEGGGEVRPLRMAAPMFAMAKAVPVAAGQQSVGADVQMVWEIH
jgi:uncharacterized protein YggE